MATACYIFTAFYLEKAARITASIAFVATVAVCGIETSLKKSGGEGFVLNIVAMVALGGYTIYLVLIIFRPTSTVTVEAEPVYVGGHELMERFPTGVPREPASEGVYRHGTGRTGIRSIVRKSDLRSTHSHRADNPAPPSDASDEVPQVLEQISPEMETRKQKTTYNSQSQSRGREAPRFLQGRSEKTHGTRHGPFYFESYNKMQGGSGTGTRDQK